MKAIELDLVKEECPKTAAWLDRMMSIPEMQEVHKGLIEKLKFF